MEKVKKIRNRIQDLLERLLDFADRLHQQAREDGDSFDAAQHRKDAELVSEARKNIWERSNSMNVHSLDNSVRATERANLNHTQITEHSKLLPWLMFTAVFSGLALATSVFCYLSIHDLHERDRDEIVIMKNDLIRFRVQLMSNDALLLREGIKQPSDMWNGPEGNLEYGRKDRPKGK